MLDRAIFKRAADQIRLRGWCQKALTDSEGRVCAMGALYEAVGIHTKPGPQPIDVSPVNPAYRDVVNATALAAIKLHGSVPWWNDRPERTEAEVLALFEELSLG